MSALASVRIGIGLRDGVTAVRDAAAAERYGFDSVFCGEHLFFHGPVSNPFIILSAVAGATRSVRLLTAVTLVPLYPPALLAKLAATLDVVSGGRLDLGVGVGGEFAAEFAAAGVLREDRGTLMDRGLSVLGELFCGNPARDGATGEYLDGVVLDPLPVQAGGPPVWVAGRSARARARAARWGQVWMPYLVSPDQLASGLEDVRRHVADLGRAEGSVTGAVHAFVFVDWDARKANESARRWVSRTYDRDIETMDRFLVAGTPDTCTARVAELHEAGAASVNLSLACAPDETERVMRLLGEDVLPGLR
ncbi:LLM class flavin-dependent oxidoreductase [Ornithinimicrobium faecis]|uniref:LLM class flavin-dependent oxidoreductase n=1 Tax=Ornithinimicrobium faecis TaxID=2934158 RepID=UPI0021185894|nr:LLM class flavin-dependent oxidoreductase [Ornithinimicrobium sp. HY1745]